MRRPKSDYEQQRQERYLSRAAFFGMWLRAQGFDAEEAAGLVADRYPGVRSRIAGLLEAEERRAAAAGGY